MKVEKYQRKINDVISKCPIEAGVVLFVKLIEAPTIRLNEAV